MAMCPDTKSLNMMKHLSTTMFRQMSIRICSLFSPLVILQLNMEPRTGLCWQFLEAWFVSAGFNVNLVQALSSLTAGGDAAKRPAPTVERLLLDGALAGVFFAQQPC